jgi:hypothetical protein
MIFMARTDVSAAADDGIVSAARFRDDLRARMQGSFALYSGAAVTEQELAAAHAAKGAER